MTADERIAALRTEMKKESIDFYLVPTADFHGSEYVGDYFKCRAYLTGFSGSAGTAVIAGEEAGLWTDGRYFGQAEKELAGSGVTLYRMGTAGTPSVREYLKEKLYAGSMLAFDGRCVSAKAAKEYRIMAKEVNAGLRTDLDLIDRIWTDRPALPKAPVRVLDMKICGETAASKLSRIREEMAKEQADVHIVSSLYDIAWILNIRGGDIRHVPVPLAFLCMTASRADLFIDESKLNEEVVRYLDGCGVRVFDYDTIYETLASFPPHTSVLLDTGTVNDRLAGSLPQGTTLIDRPNPSERMRAIKNQTEISCTRAAHIRDGVAVTKFIYWLKGQMKKKEVLTEYDAAAYLDGLRERTEGYLDLSFETISAYGANAAMMHYQAGKDHAALLKPGGMLLVDSGGHYIDGTTDITRTIVLGQDLPQEQKEAYTRVLIGNLCLANVRFLKGCAGWNLDILAREKLWEVGIDYRSGTGHGVGHILNVHEGPNAFRIRKSQDPKLDETILPGMITTDEPGVYIDGAYGVRLENELLCVAEEENEYGLFLSFRPLTFAPMDRDAIEPSLMEAGDLQRLNDYQQAVYDTISPYLDRDEADWLYAVTRPIG